MIRIKKLTKKYNKSIVLKDISLTLPDIGMIGIIGPSGCGKSTLLKCTSGLIDYDGKIYFESTDLSLLTENEKADFRIKNIGFIFQDFKLFENQSVYQNITFAQNIIFSDERARKRRKCEEVLDIVSLKVPLNKNVDKLSGGEKQRVAIARALINSPSLILADEPTGSLDSANAKEIMSILAKISLKKLVVVVSHDNDLINEYCDQIIKLKDGIVDKIIYNKKEDHDRLLPLSNCSGKAKKPSLPLDFLFFHTINSIKEKKYRTGICNSVMSLGLIGIGLALTLSSSVSTNIKNAYASFANENRIVASVRNKDLSKTIQYSSDFDEVSSIAINNKEFINGVGCTYKNDFEEFFKDLNELVLYETTTRTSLEGFGARRINDFIWLNSSQEKFYPKKYQILENDEIVLGINFEQLEELCFALRITRTVSSLNEYLQSNRILCYFDLANYYWNYFDEVSLSIVGFALTSEPAIFHTNKLWNEWVFESVLKLPTSLNVNSVDAKPWTLKKIYYLNTIEEPSYFLSAFYSNPYSSNISLEIANEIYYPWLYKTTPISERKRILCFKRNQNFLSTFDTSNFSKVMPEITNFIYGSAGGYFTYPEALLMGFSKEIFFSCSESLINEVEDIFSITEISDNSSLFLPNGVEMGHYSKSISDGVNFQSIKNENVKGRKPKNLDEIAISSTLSRSLLGNENCINQDLYLNCVVRENIINNATIKKTFKQVKLKIVGIIPSNKNLIYHDSLWTILFFQCKLGVPLEELTITDFIFETENSKTIDKTINTLSKSFPKYKFVNPMEPINSSINEVCNYLRYALFALSFISSLISTLLLILTNYLHQIDNKKDLELAYQIGVKRKETLKFSFMHSFVISMISFFISSLELLIISLALSFEFSKTLGTEFAFALNPLSFVAMLSLAIFISFSSSLIINSKMLLKTK